MNTDEIKTLIKSNSNTHTKKQIEDYIESQGATKKEIKKAFSSIENETIISKLKSNKILLSLLVLAIPTIFLNIYLFGMFNITSYLIGFLLSLKYYISSKKEVRFRTVLSIFIISSVYSDLFTNILFMIITFIIIILNLVNFTLSIYGVMIYSFLLIIPFVLTYKISKFIFTNLLSKFEDKYFFIFRNKNNKIYDFKKVGFKVCIILYLLVFTGTAIYLYGFYNSMDQKMERSFERAYEQGLGVSYLKKYNEKFEKYENSQYLNDFFEEKLKEEEILKKRILDTVSKNSNPVAQMFLLNSMDNLNEGIILIAELGSRSLYVSEHYKTINSESLEIYNNSEFNNKFYDGTLNLDEHYEEIKSSNEEIYNILKENGNFDERKEIKDEKHKIELIPIHEIPDNNFNEVIYENIGESISEINEKYYYRNVIEKLKNENYDDVKSKIIIEKLIQKEYFNLIENYCEEQYTNTEDDCKINMINIMKDKKYCDEIYYFEIEEEYYTCYNITTPELPLRFR